MFTAHHICLWQYFKNVKWLVEFSVTDAGHNTFNASKIVLFFNKGFDFVLLGTYPANDFAGFINFVQTGALQHFGFGLGGLVALALLLAVLLVGVLAAAPAAAATPAAAAICLVLRRLWSRTSGTSRTGGRPKRGKTRWFSSE